jgi:hypothetical protein
MRIKTKTEKQRRAEDEEVEPESERWRAGDVETARAKDWRGCKLGFRAAAGYVAAARAGDRGSELGFSTGGDWIGTWEGIYIWQPGWRALAGWPLKAGRAVLTQRADFSARARHAPSCRAGTGP